MSPDFSLVDLKGISEVANKLIDKISDIAGFIYDQSGLRKSKNTAYASVIKEISERKDIDPFERLALITDHKRILKEYKNNTDIINVALKNIKPHSKPEDLDEDWLAYFFSKSKNICSDEMKFIWGKILAEETNKSDSISKSLMHILSVMSKEDASMFNSLIPFCFDTDNEEDPIVLPLFDNNDDIYKLRNISFYTFFCCDRLGLLKIISPRYYFNGNKVMITYGNKKYELTSCVDSDNKIMIGNCSLTIEGTQLARICERKYSNDILDYSINKWNETKVNIEVKF